MAKRQPLTGLASALSACAVLAACGPAAKPAAVPEPAPVAAAPAAPRERTCSVTLNGAGALVETPSLAAAVAAVTLDPEARSVSLYLTATGLTLDQLFDPLTTSPIGPIHFHRYGSHVHSGTDDVALVVPVTFGPAYAASPEGFTVKADRIEFDSIEALTGSVATFDDLITALDEGRIILNIHTDAYPDGEIGGVITPTR